jgi:intracellular sulfur oxidation DsrE/DsrF family protein
MRGLTIIVRTSTSVQANAELASTVAVMGGRARLYFERQAVEALAASPLLGEARDMGVELLACQTALADAGLALDALLPGTRPCGLVHLMQTLGDDRLVIG